MLNERLYVFFVEPINWLSSWAIVLQYALLGAGLLYCFAGYRIYRFLIALAGIIAGGGLGVMIAIGISLRTRDANTALVAFIAAPLICAILGGWLATFIEDMAVFCQGFLACGGLTALLLLGINGRPEIFWVVLAGVGGGFIAIWTKKMFIITTTAFIGAMFATGGLLTLIRQQLYQWAVGRHGNPYEFIPIAALLSWSLLTGLGILVQMKSVPKQPEPTAEEPTTDGPIPNDG